MDTHKNIPISDITTWALPRDRTLITIETMDELQNSIAQNGLRLPIELIANETGYSLISGYRRLFAFQRLFEQTKDEKYATIPAFIRDYTDTTALAAMVEENEIRQPLSPWERGHIIVRTTENGSFESADAAIQALFPHASRQKRAKLRAISEVVWEFDGVLTDPELLSERQLMRLANAIRHDWADILHTALNELRGLDSRQEWARLLPILAEVEGLIANNHSTNPNTPRRNITPRPGIIIRRERTKYGFCFHISGSKASGMLMNSVLDEIERWLTDG